MNAGTAAKRALPPWSATAIVRLLDTVCCPVCESGDIAAQRCPACGADFDGAVGGELWQASQVAADALRARQSVLDRVPVGAASARAVSAAPAPAVGPPVQATAVAVRPSSFDEPPVPLGDPAASATVQSVLAIAGAGLVAVAAIVFTFFNPDLADALPRALIVGGISVAFLAGAGLLARRGLRFSAEAIGALGIVFLALTLTAALPLLPPGANAWMIAALATLFAGGAMAALGLAAGIRSWLWSALLALAFVPWMLALGAGSALATVAGCLSSAAAASALVSATRRAPSAFANGLAAERGALTVTQFGFAAVALFNAWAAGTSAGIDPLYAISATLITIAVLAACSARHPAGSAWSALAGGAGVAAVTLLPLASLTTLPTGWQFGLVPAAAGLALVGIGALRPLHRAVVRGALFGGAVAVVALVAIIPTATALLSLGATAVARNTQSVLLPADGAVALTLGLAALAITLMAFAALTARDEVRVSVNPEPHTAETERTPAVAASAPGDDGARTSMAAQEAGAAPTPAGVPALGTRWLGFLGEWYGVLAALTVLCIPGIAVWGRIIIGLAFAVAVGIAVATTRLRDASAAVRVPLVAGAHAAVVLAGLLSWTDLELAVPAGVAIVGTIGVLALTVPRSARFVHMGIAFAYGLVILATGLARAGLDPVVVLCLTTCAAGVVAIAATFSRRVAPRPWLAILVVTVVPFAAGVVQVVFVRSGWTALSTTVIVLLALTLATTTRSGLGIVVRTLAAAVLVPAVAVVAVCLGAQLLAMSGSPVVLPVIAVIVAAVLPASEIVEAQLNRRTPLAEARAARLAIEASALLTAAIAVALAVVRDAAGLPTTLLVLVILGIGFAATAHYAGRRYGWWLAGLAFTGALWSAWGIAGIAGLEPYLLPPALGAATVGAVLTARGLQGAGLFTAGLATAIVPVLLAQALGGTTALAVIEPQTTEAMAPWRACALVAAAWLLVCAAAFVARRSGRIATRVGALRAPALGLAIVAAAAVAVQGVRWGIGLDTAPPVDVPLVLVCLVFGAVGAGAAAFAAYGLHSTATANSESLADPRWVAAPAVLYLTVATWPGIERSWIAIWTMWALMLALLVFMVAVAARGLRRRTALPPVWFLFAVSFATAVVAWSPRELRVEWFSLPLGLFLLTAGALAMRMSPPAPSGEPAPRSLADWPTGWRGSWPLLAPGLLVMLSASVAATYTDPRTWRAILVMAIALVAILVGAVARLAAPFLIGIVVLPIENVLAFMVQIGRGIEAMPWWITLSVVGVVLLIIAVGYERRTGDDTGLAARLRDLA